jgi:hypothetical protein
MKSYCKKKAYMMKLSCVKWRQCIIICQNGLDIICYKIKCRGMEQASTRCWT